MKHWPQGRYTCTRFDPGLLELRKNFQTKSSRHLIIKTTRDMNSRPHFQYYVGVHFLQRIPSIPRLLDTRYLSYNYNMITPRKWFCPHFLIAPLFSFFTLRERADSFFVSMIHALPEVTYMCDGHVTACHSSVFTASLPTHSDIQKIDIK